MIKLLDIAVIIITDFLMNNSRLTVTAKYNSVLGKVIEVRLDGKKVVQLNAEATDGRGVRVVVVHGAKMDEYHCATRDQLQEIFFKVL